MIDRTVDESNTPTETFKTFVNRKHLAYDMTPKFSNEVVYLKPHERYFQLSRSQKVTKQTEKIKKHHN